ncbi:hypothetical protein T484DRAFT_1917822, partial [Baffinella frigidus]
MRVDMGSQEIWHLLEVLFAQCRSREQSRWGPAVRWLREVAEHSRVKPTHVADAAGVLITLSREAYRAGNKEITSGADGALRVLMSVVAKRRQEGQEWSAEEQERLVATLTRHLSEGAGVVASGGGPVVRLVLMEWLDFALSAFPACALQNPRLVQRDVLAILSVTTSDRVAALALQVVGNLVRTRVEPADLPETLVEVVQLLKEKPAHLERRLQQGVLMLCDAILAYLQLIAYEATCDLVLMMLRMHAGDGDVVMLCDAIGAAADGLLDSVSRNLLMVMLMLCDAIGAEAAFAAVAEMVEKESEQEEDLALAHLIVHEMNLLLLSEPSLHVLRALLPSAASPPPSAAAPATSKAQAAFFLRLYRPWCVHPAAALALCLVTHMLRVWMDAGLAVK